MRANAWKKWWRRLRDVVIVRVLHLDDTPHRIALGVAIGMFVAFTPTLGFQMLISVAIAALLRVNKAAAVPPVWITNPVTVVPCYYFTWRVGHYLITLGEPDEAAIRNVYQFISSVKHAGLSQIFTAEFWSSFFTVTKELGAALWVGGCVVGLVGGVVGYFLTHWAVSAFRRHPLRHLIIARAKRRMARRRSPAPSKRSRPIVHPEQSP